jgi:hypothetical protein
MDNLIVEPTKSTPQLNFDVKSGVLKISGQSYPENAAKFYEPVMSWIKEYFENSAEKTILEINIIYLNTSSSKVFINIFDMFEDQHQNGNNIEIRWLYDPENEVSMEWGEEFREGLECPFELVEIKE